MQPNKIFQFLFHLSSYVQVITYRKSQVLYYIIEQYPWRSFLLICTIMIIHSDFIRITENEVGQCSRANLFTSFVFDTRPPPPPTQCYLGYAYARTLFLKAPHPLSEDCQHFRTPLSRAFRGLFAGFSCLGDPLKSRKMLNEPPLIQNNFSGVQRDERKKEKHPFLKKSPGEKSNTPLFLQFSGRTLSHEKYPFTGHFGNTHVVIPTSEWGGGGGFRHE